MAIEDVYNQLCQDSSMGLDENILQHQRSLKQHWSTGHRSDEVWRARG